MPNKIRNHYENYLEDYADFNSWVAEAGELWKKKNPITRKWPSSSIEYP